MQVPLDARIGLIRENLHDRYKAGFPIVKELVQNADDAGAARLDFGFSSGLTDARHPLLRGPALFVINDGSFTDKNAEAINSIGISSKSAEQTTIGKFGLGLKSVFHFCEAFFYLTKGEDYFNLVNPWSEGDHGKEVDRIHSNWNLHRDDAELIRRYITPFVASPHYFALWLPLRQKRHQSGNAPIMEFFPGDASHEWHDLLFGSDVKAATTGTRCANLMPFLGNLKQITYWRASTSDSPPQLLFQIELDAKARRRCQFDTLRSGGEQEFQGEVSIRQAGERRSQLLTFVGREKLLQSSELSGLQISEEWPRQTITDSVTFAPRIVKDKAKAHAAVCFALYPKSLNESQLQIGHSVFLPVGESSVKTLSVGGDDVYLTLHGYFFVDAGRSRIDGVELSQTNEESSQRTPLRERWNGLLFQQGTLPLVLPVLDQFVAQTALHERQIEALTEALAESDIYHSDLFRQALCKDYQWICLIGPGQRTWKTVPANETVHAIPRPPLAEPERAFAVMPELARIDNLVYDSSPHLSAHRTFARWTAQQLLKVLSIDVAEVFASHTRLEYFINFLETCAHHVIDDPNLSKRLLAIGNLAIATLGLAVLRKNSSLFARFCSLIPPEKRITFARSTQQDVADFILQTFAQIENIPFLLLPSDLDEKNSAKGTLPSDQVIQLLEVLVDITALSEQEGIFDEARSGIALALLGATRDRDSVLRQCRTYKLFLGVQVTREGSSTVLLSFVELGQRLQQKLLFKFANPPRPNGLSKELSLALKGGTITLLRAPLADELLGTSAVNTCEANGCVATLALCPQLADVEFRLELFNKLLAEGQRLEGSYANALRYLIHGNPVYYESDESLLASNDVDSIWQRVAEQVFTTNPAEAWRLIPQKFADSLSANVRIVLKIQNLGRQGVVSMLRLLSSDTLAELDLTALDTQFLLLQIEDNWVVQHLPIHFTVDGERAVLDLGHTYEEGNFPVPNSLLQDIVLLRRTNDEQVRKRYESLGVPIFTSHVALNHILNHQHSHHLWREIMDALNDFSTTPAHALHSRLSTIVWLPLRNGKSIAPREIIFLKGMEEEIAHLLAATGTAYVDVLQIDPSVIAHAAWSKLCRWILPPNDDAILLLGMALESTSDYHVGTMGGDLSLERLNEFLDLWQEDVRHTLMLAGPLLRRIYDQISPSTALGLVNLLRKAIPQERIKAILPYLERQHEKSSSKRHEAIFSWFNIFLADAALEEGFASKVLPRLKLCNQRGKWRPAHLLCHGYIGIDRGDLVDQSHAKALGLSFDRQALITDGATSSFTQVRIPTIVSDNDLVESAKVLHEYFKPWEAFVESEVIGGFLCLLGDFPNIKDIAAAYLGVRSVDTTRKLLEWRPISSPVAGKEVSGTGKYIDDVMVNQRFLIQVVDGDTKKFKVRSLVGEEFEAMLSAAEDMESLVVQEGRPVSPRMIGENQINLLCLRSVQGHQLKPQRLTELLARTALHVLEKLYYQSPSNFSEFWQDLQATEQLDIESAQDWIVEHIPHYLIQLGLRSDPVLGAIAKKWDDVDMQAVEVRHARRIHQSERLQFDPNRIKNELRHKLREIMERDEEPNPRIQTRIIDALRRKIRNDYQYQPESILFELFQNADDAVVELDLVQGETESNGELSQMVVAEINNDSLVFAHWGRAINQSTFSTPNQSDLGHRHDLQKMLTLQTSDKTANTSAEPLTGKFGLGFKSVYLITDRPEILSGRLAFEIIASLYPKRLVERRTSLEHLRAGFRPVRQHRETGTVFRLPYASEVASRDAHTSMVVFSKYAHLALVFAKRLRKCEIRRTGQPLLTAGWHLQAIEGATKLRIGALQVQVGDVTKQNPSHALLIQSAGTGSVLLTIGARGFLKFADDVPTIWVTVPTREAYKLGFIVNGHFDLDIGRAQLARASEKNWTEAKRLGSLLGDGLLELVNLAQNWKDFCAVLNLAADTSPYRFWESLWAALIEGFVGRAQSEGLDLLLEVVSSKEQGYHRLLQHAPVLPTKLTGTFQMLTLLSKVKYATSGILQSENLLSHVAQWPQFRERVPLGTLVHDDIRRALETVFAATPKIEALTLAKIIRWELNQSLRVEPAVAGQLGRLITPAFISQLSKYPLELEELRALLRSLEFCNLNGNYALAKELLGGHEDMMREPNEQDELRRMRFAPKSTLLSTDYAADAVAFFRVCRERLIAPVGLMAKWAIAAADQGQRRAVVRYCIDGELRGDFILEMRKHQSFASSWLSKLEFDDHILGHLQSEERNYFLFQLLGIRAMPDTPMPDPKLDTKATLERIYDWWIKNQRELVNEYEHQVYPNGTPPLAVHFDISQTSDQRHAWLTLFVLGASHTIGRTQPGTHRNFIQRCQSNGWFETFANPNASADDWMNVLDEYLDDDAIGFQDLQYWHLVGKQFVSIYLLSRHLRDYVDSFLYLDRAKRVTPLEQLLDSRKSTELQGSGIDAPPATKPLGIGACFVVRELMRFGIITSTLARQHCYVPVERVRNQFIELGCVLDSKPGVEQSTQIYRFLVEHLGEAPATFNNCFDLPFLMIHNKWNSIPPYLRVYR